MKNNYVMFQPFVIEIIHDTAESSMPVLHHNGGIEQLHMHTDGQVSQAFCTCYGQFMG